MNDFQEEALRREEMNRGLMAEQVLDNEIYQEAFSSLKQKLIDQWSESPAGDTEGREKLWQMTKLLSAVEGHLKEAMQTGKLARIQLEQRQSLMQRMKQGLKEWNGDDY